MEYPRYVKFQSKTKVLLTVAICFIIAIVPAIAEICFWEYAKSVGGIQINYDHTCILPVRYGTPVISLLSLFIFLFIPLFSLAALSIAFLHVLRQRLQRIKGVGPEDESTHSIAGPITIEKRTQRVKNRYLKPAMTLGAVVLALAITIMPYICYVVIIGAIWPEYLNPKVVYINIALTLFCKPIFDPVMYAVSESKIRKFYITCFRELKSRW